MKICEVGSEYSWTGLPEGPYLPWPVFRAWFSTGHDSFIALWKQYLEGNPNVTVFIPDYFCAETTAIWRRHGIQIKTYEDDPRWGHPKWETLNPSSGDMVLAVNYFGIRNGDQWFAWHKANCSVVLIEDHTHDPLSSWALNSQADYAFASVRKIFPVPEGAILWSPREYKLPKPPQGQNWTASALKLAGMLWKYEYLRIGERAEQIKIVYQSFFEKGERLLSASCDTSLAPWSKELLKSGYPSVWRQSRERNVRQFLDFITEYTDIEPLFRIWELGQCPFNAVLIFDTQAQRDTIRRHLIESQIYPPVHWIQEPETSERSRDLSRRILTIPLDQRYGHHDVQKIISCMKSILNSNS